MSDFFRKTGKKFKLNLTEKSSFWVFWPEISFSVLSPILHYPKIPYIRGGTHIKREEGLPAGHREGRISKNYDKIFIDLVTSILFALI